ncbi:MAG: SUMF1/EgtB/PvdO family nonheme iron enzyme [Phycisphaerales bacterium]|nr:SUMF1/EgtB/PvdO family nonheme iron enzyme [Phycisphaerales bacterium]
MLHELDADEHREIVAHVHACRKCRRLAADVAANLREVASLRAVAGGEKERSASAAPDAGSPPPGFCIEGYRIIRELGRGGMGVVYLAEQASPARRVALKIPRPGQMTPALRRRFAFEVQALGRLQHPGIAQIHAAGIAETAYGAQPYFAMEYVTGRPLAEYCAAEGLIRSARLELIARVCDAVQHAHQRGIIHRDLKPGNIFVDERRQTKIIDFGIARAVESDAPFETLHTEITQLVGTLPYMSPEQISGDPRELDTRTDVYAIGVVAYELLSGRLPFPIQGKPIAEAARIIDQQPAALLGSVDAGLRGDLERIVAKALEKDRERRYPSAAELGADLRRYLKGEPPSILPESAAAQLRRFVRRYRIPLGVTCAVVLAVAIGFVVSMSMYLLAQRRLEQVIRLSDLHDLRNLREELRRVSSRPESIPVFESWLMRARGLTMRIDLHRRTLAELRRHARHYTETDRLRDAGEHPGAAQLDDLRRSRAAKETELARLLRMEPTRGRDGPVVELTDAMAAVDTWIEQIERKIREDRTWTFDDAGVQWQHDVLSELIGELNAFAGTDVGFASIPDVERRAAFCRQVLRAGVDGHAEEWRRAVESIRNTGECPQYRGLRINAQMGLVPVGRDPRSGLWEFAHLQTGAIPVRGAGGILEMTEDSGLVFALLPGGTFDMGAVVPSPDHPSGTPNVDPFAHSYDQPIQTVTLDPFFLSKFEMTQGQWLRAEGVNPATWGSRWPDGEESFDLLHPVETVTWHEADETLARLALALPTEAQWECAARAGTTTVWWTGNDQNGISGAANIADRSYAAHRPIWEVSDAWLDDGFHRHAPIGRFRANAFGLHDVMGNVNEWCYDGCGPRTIPVRPGDGLRVASEGGGGLRITRGGSFHEPAAFNRSVSQAGLAPTYRSESIGVRPARAIDP